MEKIFGREREIEQIQTWLASGKEEFVALYGRRRVGKTFLIRNIFKDKFDFYATGIIGGNKTDQLGAFNDALRVYGHNGAAAISWNQAFAYLAELLKTKAANQDRVVCFIDELPCLDTHRSGFVKALDYFWNSKASWISNLFFVVCGSATSWMIRNIIDNRGGLHNRITHEMHLTPFNLRVTEKYLQDKGANWDRLSITHLYMATGGVPYYLSLLDYHSSVTDNIDSLFFSRNAELKKEYKRLFKSLYKNAEEYMAIVKLLAKHKQGMTRNDIAKALKTKSGGHLSDMLEDLVNCDFLIEFNNGTSVNNCIYRLVDFYTLFYNHFCTRRSTDDHFWRNQLGTPTLNTWYGLAFERVCLMHIEEIKSALHLDTIHVEYYSWRSKSSNPGAQIDLVIDRADGIVTICEIKYSQAEYRLTSEEYAKIINRVETFKGETKTRKGYQIVLITTYGTTKNNYTGIMNRDVKLDDLFQKIE